MDNSKNIENKNQCVNENYLYFSLD